MSAAESRPFALRAAAARGLAALLRGCAILLLVLGTAGALSFPLWKLATGNPALFTRSLGIFVLALAALAVGARIRRRRSAGRSGRPRRDPS